MLTEKMTKALNDQINAEMFSSYLYLAMAAYFEDIDYAGFAHWMRMQADEETMHAMKFYDYVIERQGRVVLQALDEPQAEWASPLEAFEEAFKHEQYISKRINDLMDLAHKESDHATASFLKWFVDEQVEEEASVDAVIQDMRRVQDVPMGMFMMNRELGGRTAEAADGDEAA